MTLISSCLRALSRVVRVRVLVELWARPPLAPATARIGLGRLRDNTTVYIICPHHLFLSVQASDAAGLQSHLGVARGELEAARKQLGEAAAARADMEQRLAASVAECERAKQQAQVGSGQAREQRRAL